MDRLFRNALTMAHHFISRVLLPGNLAIDATAGNGHDTLFLAKTVGRTGQVWAFDVQEQALQNTRDLLQANNVLDRVHLVHAGHQELDRYVKNPVQACMFNLGYLPGGDHGLVTKPETTVTALTKAMDLLLPGGLITIVIYTGHAGGLEEREAVEGYLEKLPQDRWDVVKIHFPNRRGNSPNLVALQKFGGTVR